MKCLRVGPLWGVAVLSCGAMACTDQHPPLPLELTMQAAKPSGVKPDDPDVEVNETDPSAAEQDTTVNVRVLGSGFDRGSEATWLLGGVAKPEQVRTNSTKYVSDKELKANITISLDAEVALWDVEVMTRRGKKGIGIEAFQVKEKTPPGQVEFDDYVGIDLGTLGRRKGMSRAGQVNDPFPNGMMLVTGKSQADDKSDELPVMWEVTVTADDTAWIGPTALPLPPGFYSGTAGRSSGDGHYLTGWVTYDEGELTLYRAVRWEYLYGSGIEAPLTFEPVDGPDDPGGGFIVSVGRDVNVHGDLVGSSVADHGVEWDTNNDGDIDFKANRVATFWDGTSRQSAPLFSPLGGLTYAWAVNNQKYVVGYGRETAYFDPYGELEKHAMLWLLDGTPCDLGETGTSSEAFNITDVGLAGTMMVSGTWDSQGTVWEVEPDDAGQSCTVLHRWTLDVPSIVGGIRLIEGGWETVGMGEIITPGQNHPLSWRKDFTGLSVTPLWETGRAYGVNSLGQIGGFAAVKDVEHAMLWLPKNN